MKKKQEKKACKFLRPSTIITCIVMVLAVYVIFRAEEQIDRYLNFEPGINEYCRIDDGEEYDMECAIMNGVNWGNFGFNERLLQMAAGTVFMVGLLFLVNKEYK